MKETQDQRFGGTITVNRKKRLLIIGVGFLTILIVAPVGYMFIEGWGLLDSIFMTIITIATIGYGEPHALSDTGKIYTICLIVTTYGLIVYGVPQITSYLVEGDLTFEFRRRKMQSEIKKLKDHYIVCGAGRTGRYAIEELNNKKKALVVIDRDAKAIEDLQNEHLCVEGDATCDGILKNAGIEGAAGLIAALGTDADNIVLVLTARLLKKRLKIVAQALEAESEEKLKKAGADQVIVSRKSTGQELARGVIA